jgi:mRNA interferase MazF
VVIRRGEIWWASLLRPTGSGPGYRRPVLVVQADDFNVSLIQTVIAAVITSNLTLARAPGNVLCSRKQTRLSRDSVVNVSQIVTLDKTLFTQRVSMVPAELLRQIEDGLWLVMHL